MVFKWKEEHTPIFLEHYRNYPCLWNFVLESYKNRIERGIATESLIKDLNIEGVTERDVKLKIKSIRTRYAAELKKIKQSKANGNTENVYVPKLFWFKQADEFLSNVSTPRDSMRIRIPLVEEFSIPSVDSLERSSSISPCSDSKRFKSSPPDNHSYSERQEMLWIDAIKKSSSTEEINNLQSAEAQGPGLSSWSSSSTPRFKANQSESQGYCVVEDRLTTPRQDDEFDIIGKNVATKLRSLPTIQKIYAEKIINDTLFEAQLNNLSRFSRLDNRT